MKNPRIASKVPFFLAFSTFFCCKNTPIPPYPARLFFSYFIVRRTNRAQIPYKTTAIREKSNDTVFRPVFQLIVLTIL